MQFFKEIEFQGRNFILVGGAITTEEAYEAGMFSYAHLNDDGTIYRYGTKIGNKEDMVFTGREIETLPTMKTYLALLANIDRFLYTLGMLHAEENLTEE